MAPLDRVFPADSCRPPATEAEIDAVEQRLEVTLPADYRAFLGHTNGFNDRILGGGDALYLRLHPAERVVTETLTTDVIADFFPAAVIIGDTGGSWFFAINFDHGETRYQEIGRGEAEVLAELGATFDEFIDAFAARADG